jgi:hypothetical protein
MLMFDLLPSELLVHLARFGRLRARVRVRLSSSNSSFPSSSSSSSSLHLILEGFLLVSSRRWQVMSDKAASGSQEFGKSQKFKQN